MSEKMSDQMKEMALTEDTPGAKKEETGNPWDDTPGVQPSDMSLEVMSGQEINRRLSLRSERNETLNPNSEAYDLLRFTSSGWAWDQVSVGSMDSKAREGLLDKLSKSGVKI